MPIYISGPTASIPDSTQNQHLTRNPVGAIVGGVFGGLAIIAIGGTLFIVRRRRRLRAMKHDSSPSRGVTDFQPAADMTDPASHFIISPFTDTSMRVPQRINSKAGAQLAAVPAQQINQASGSYPDPEILRREMVEIFDRLRRLETGEGTVRTAEAPPKYH
jgi:hypothetical protein